MRYRKFNSEDISLLGFGFMRPPYKNGRIDHEQMQNMVDVAIENGVNYFDTAYVYWGGKSESLLGQMIKRHDRSKLNIATKLMLNSIKRIDELDTIFNTQLERLSTDYIDFYMFHMVTEMRWEAYVESGLYEFLAEKKKQGKIRYIGFSFHDKPGFLSVVCNAYNWDFAQIQLNYMDWTVQKAKEQYEYLTEKNMPVWVMEPVRGGELARLSEESKALFPQEAEATATSYALRWSMSFPNVVCVLSGMSSIDQLTENIATALKYKRITKAEQNMLNKVLKIHLSTGAIPCSGCGYCVDECPMNVDIPTTFSLYNDYLRHGMNFLRFYGHISSGRRADRCISCGKCVQNCPQHVNIPSELTKICEAVQKMNDNKSKKISKKIAIDFNDIRVSDGLFKVNKDEHGIIHLFRQRRHCIGKPLGGENRWVRFPLNQVLNKGDEYILDFTVKTSRPLLRSFFTLGAGGKTEYLKTDLLPQNEWCSCKIKFIANAERIGAVCLTATDLPIVGDIISIKKLELRPADDAQK